MQPSVNHAGAEISFAAFGRVNLFKFITDHKLILWKCTHSVCLEILGKFFAKIAQDLFGEGLAKFRFKDDSPKKFPGFHLVNFLVGHIHVSYWLKISIFTETQIIVCLILVAHKDVINEPDWVSFVNTAVLNALHHHLFQFTHTGDMKQGEVVGYSRMMQEFFVFDIGKEDFILSILCSVAMMYDSEAFFEVFVIHEIVIKHFRWCFKKLKFW